MDDDDEIGGIVCPICNEIVSDDVTWSKLTEAGVITIVKACKLRNVPVVNAVCGGKVHNDCRRDCFLMYILTALQMKF